MFVDFKELNTLEKVLGDIETLKKRSELLETLLRYYDEETMTFNIPKNWKSKNVHPSKRPASGPRQLVYDKIKDVIANEIY